MPDERAPTSCTLPVSSDLNFLASEVRVSPGHLPSFPPLGRTALLGFAALSVIGACDDDLTAPGAVDLTPVVLNDSVIGRQEALRFLFNTRIDPRTASDPENVVVTNLCTGLRMIGAIRVGTDSAAGRDTVIFSPAQPIPFVTPITARVQNILSPTGQAMGSPFILRVRTEDPPVSDVTWEELDSPTLDNSSAFSSSIATEDFIRRSLGLFFARSARLGNGSFSSRART